VLTSLKQHVLARGQSERLPWLLLLFIATVFFFASHDPQISLKAADGFNPTQDDLIALADSGSITRRLALLSLGAFGVSCLSYTRGTRVRLQGLLRWVLPGYVVWAALSLFWAEDVSLTLRRLVVFAVLCVASFAIARRHSVREIVYLAFFWSLLFLLVGICAEIALGAFHPWTAGYRFAGTQHPNSQGVNCAILLLSGFAAGTMQERRRIFFRSCAGVGALFLILTGSRTAFAAAVCGLAAYWIMMSSLRAVKLAVPFAVVAILALTLATPGGLFAAVGNAFMLGRVDDAKSESFNGRSGIWEVIGYYIQQHPISGYGYGGFWTERHIREISAEENNWPVGSAHCAYLECLLSQGAVGLTAFIAAFLIGITRSIRLQRSTRTAAFAFAGAFLVVCLTDGLLESIIIDLTLPAFLSMIMLVRLALACGPLPARRIAPVHQSGRSARSAAQFAALGLHGPGLTAQERAGL
jgi:O-antigen ligase